MNFRNLPWIQISLTVAFVALITWVYIVKMEWYEHDVTRGYSSAARENPLLAATRLIRQYDYSAYHVQDGFYFNDLESKDNQIIWIIEADAISEEKIFDSLAEWTNNGGHLILGLDNPMSDKLEELLATFELEVYTDYDLIGQSPRWVDTFNETLEEHIDEGTEDVLTTRSPHADSASNYTPWFSGASHTETVFTFRPNPSQQQSITVEYSNDAEIFPLKKLVHGVPWPDTNKAEQAYVNAQVRHGKGLVTVLGDAEIFTNRNLHKHDNSAYLLHLLSAHPSTELNYFTTVRNTPTLLSTLWRKFPVMLSLFGMALLGWVFHAASRLGPIRTEQAAGRTNLISHLRARGHFWRRRGDLTPMSEPVRQAALRVIRRQYGNSLKPNDTDIPVETIKKIAEDIGCPVADVQRALNPQPLRARELPNATFVLQNILHKSLPRSSKATGYSS